MDGLHRIILKYDIEEIRYYGVIWVIYAYNNYCPKYTLSCSNYNTTFYMLDTKIINRLSSNLIRNLGLRMIGPGLNGKPLYILTDVEEYEQTRLWNGFAGASSVRIILKTNPPVYINF